MAILLVASAATADRFNGFAVSNATIPVEHILSGGPPRDGIPSIDRPQFIKAEQASFLKDGDEVVGISIAGESRAYPLRILVWHEIVNDEIAGQPIAVTYCPLCGTAMVFSREVGAQTLDYGVSGLLYHSDVLMYDRQTESLWSQLGMKSVSGPLVNTPLEWLPSEQLTWAAWRKKHPAGQVLSAAAGSRRDYSGQAYAGYMESPYTMFPIPFTRPELSKKDWVAGVIVGGQASAYPIKLLTTNEIIYDRINDTELAISYDATRALVKVSERTSGKEWPAVKVYWFAWQAFYPETKLWGISPKKVGHPQ